MREFLVSLSSRQRPSLGKLLEVTARVLCWGRMKPAPQEAGAADWEQGVLLVDTVLDTRSRTRTGGTTDHSLSYLSLGWAVHQRGAWE